MRRRLSRRGFTLIEVAVGMLFLLAAGTLLPAFSQDLVTGNFLWEKRLAIHVIDAQLDRMCTRAGPSFNNFNGIASTTNGVTSAPVPKAITDIPELFAGIQDLVGGTWTQTVRCVDGNSLVSQLANVDGSCPAGETLKQVQVTVNWTSRNRAVSVPSANYLISKTGICGG